MKQLFKGDATRRELSERISRFAQTGFPPKPEPIPEPNTKAEDARRVEMIARKTVRRAISPVTT